MNIIIATANDRYIFDGVEEVGINSNGTLQIQFDSNDSGICWSVTEEMKEVESDDKTGSGAENI